MMNTVRLRRGKASLGALVVAAVAGGGLVMAPPASAAAGTITTYAGSDTAGYSGDGGPAIAALLRGPGGIATNANGDLYFVDNGNSVVRKIARDTGIISTYAGNGLGCGDDSPGSCGDGGPALSAGLRGPSDVAFDAGGNLLISTERTLHRVDKTTGKINVIAGTGQCETGATGLSPLSTPICVVAGLAVDPSGNIFLVTGASGGTPHIRKMDPQGTTIAIVAGAATQGFSGDGGPATLAQIQGPRGMATDSAGNLFFADSENGRIRRIDASTGTISTYAGVGTGQCNSTPCPGDGGPAVADPLGKPLDVALDAAGNLFISEFFSCKVRRVDVGSKIITTAVGNGSCSNGGDGGPATMAGLAFAPNGLVVDPFGDLFISMPNRIRKVESAGAPAPPATVIFGSTWYSDGSVASSGGTGTAVSAYAVGAFANLPYQMVLATSGCGTTVAVLNANVRFATSRGFIGTTVGSIPAGVAAGAYVVCFKSTPDVSSPTGTGVVGFTLRSAAQ